MRQMAHELRFPRILAPFGLGPPLMTFLVYALSKHRVLNRAKDSRESIFAEHSSCLQGTIRGSIAARLSNELSWSLSYTWFRLQRLIESSCKIALQKGVFFCGPSTSFSGSLSRSPQVDYVRGSLLQKVVSTIGRELPSPRYSARLSVPEEPNNRVSHPLRTILSTLC